MHIVHHSRHVLLYPIVKQHACNMRACQCRPPRCSGLRPQLSPGRKHSPELLRTDPGCPEHSVPDLPRSPNTAPMRSQSTNYSSQASPKHQIQRPRAPQSTKYSSQASTEYQIQLPGAPEHQIQCPRPPQSTKYSVSPPPSVGSRPPSLPDSLARPYPRSSDRF